MSHPLLTTRPWRIILVMIGIVPLTVWCGAKWGSTGGAVTLAAFVLPVACVALAGQHGWSLLAVSITIVGIFGEAILAGGPYGGSGLRFATVGTVSLSSMALVVSATVRMLRAQVQRHREELQMSASNEWDELIPPTIPEPQLSDESIADSADHPSLDFPRLLVTIQDIGRRVSMNFDLTSVVRAIITTAQTSLDCTECSVFLWDRSTQLLTNPLPDRPRDANVYAPSPSHGLGAWVMAERQIVYREDVETDVELQVVAASESHIPDAVAPLIVANECVGLLVVDGVRERSPNFEGLLYTLANVYAMGIRNSQLFRRVEEMAHRDGLTKLYNHATFQQKLSELGRQALLSEGRFALIMSDADRFKLINDTYGHQAGDEVLSEMARLWKAVMPEGAILARYGGEEFIAALPDVDLQRAVELAEYLRESIASHPFMHNNLKLQVTASFGVSEYSRPDQSIDDVVREADQSLYDAKKQGRNRVVSRGRRRIISLRKPS